VVENLTLGDCRSHGTSDVCGWVTFSRTGEGDWQRDLLLVYVREIEEQGSNISLMDESKSWV